MLRLNFRNFKVSFEHLRQVLVVLSILIVVLIYLLSVQHSFTGVEQTFQERDDLRILNAGDIVTRVAFGQSPKCGGTDCWLLPGFQDESWVQVSVPTTSLREVPGYKDRRKDDYVYYRFKVPVPWNLVERTDLVFSPRYVYHNNFVAYADGHEVLQGQRNVGSGKSTLIPLQNVRARDGRIIVAIRATASNGETGIFSRTPMFLGTSAALADLNILDRMHIVEYYLRHFLIKAVIFSFFALAFLYSQPLKGMRCILVFLGCSTVDSLLVGNFLTSVLSQEVRVSLFFFLRTFAALALIKFFFSFFEIAVQKSIGRLFILSVLGITLVQVAGYWVLSEYYLIRLEDMFAYVNTLELGAFSIGLLLAIMSVFAGNKDHFILQDKFQRVLFACVLTVMVGFLIYEFYFVEYIGLEKRSYAEVAVGYAVAICVTRRFGQTERELRSSVEELRDVKVDAAIAQAAKMLAHDVRAPFSSLQMMLEFMDQTSDASNIIAMKERVLPQLKHKLSSVDTMVSEVLEVSAKGGFPMAPVSIPRIIDITLQGLASNDKMRTARFTYSFLHRHKVMANAQKLERVLYNIISNALDAAVGDIKHIWFDVREHAVDGDKFIQIVVGNSGSYVPDEWRNKIFDPFFTREKSNGTGLGLAIARKLVNGHGGTIWCQSSREKGTEFCFTLSVSEEVDYFADLALWTRGESYQRLSNRKGALGSVDCNEQNPIH